jgi:MraZ protein
MFRGNHPARVDEKGRLKVPAEHKKTVDEKFGTVFYITSRNGGRAEIYPMKVWERIEEDLANQPSSEAKSLFEDAVNYWGQVIEMDGQGRLLIPQKLREKAGLLGEVAVIGKHDRLEVVNDEMFASKLEAQPFTTAHLAELNIKGI